MAVRTAPPFEYLQTIELGKAEIENHGVEVLAVAAEPSVLAVARTFDEVAGARERTLDAHDSSRT